jgi:hypothetical protein
MKGHMKRKWGASNFYEEAAQCVKIPYSTVSKF